LLAWCSSSLTVASGCLVIVGVGWRWWLGVVVVMCFLDLAPVWCWLMVLEEFRYSGDSCGGVLFRWCLVWIVWFQRVLVMCFQWPPLSWCPCVGRIPFSSQ
jgi:hypothetical protein